jgi:hypothetical protein
MGAARVRTSAEADIGARVFEYTLYLVDPHSLGNSLLSRGWYGRCWHGNSAKSGKRKVVGGSGTSSIIG